MLITAPLDLTLLVLTITAPTLFLVELPGFIQQPPGEGIIARMQAEVSQVVHKKVQVDATVLRFVSPSPVEQVPTKHDGATGGDAGDISPPLAALLAGLCQSHE